MNRQVLLLISMLTLFTLGHAEPVDPSIRKKIKTEEGKLILVRAIGDEYGYYWQSLSDGSCYSVSEQNGFHKRISPDKVRVNAMLSRRAEQTSSHTKTRRAFSVEKLRGQKHVPVILMEFADKSFAPEHNIQLFNEMMNGLGEEAKNAGLLIGSVKDYFLAQSNQLLDLTFDVYGPVKLSKSYSYYGEDVSHGDSFQLDPHLGEAAAEAISNISGNVDFSVYDWDGDGIVEQVMFIYAWYGQNISYEHPETIYPQKSNLAYYGITPIECNGVKINDFACAPELRMTSEGGNTILNGIGTFCHEFSHTLGLPDMYDGDNKYYGTRIWDIMGGGGHNDFGRKPAGFTSYEKMALGWQQPVVLQNDTVINDIQAASEGGNFYMIPNNNHEEEYYLLENRQQTGWDSGLPGHGLLILHVDYDEYLFAHNMVNSSKNAYPRCSIIIADNDSTTSTIPEEYIAKYQGDLFPYGQNDSLTNNSVPKAILYHANLDGTSLMSKSVLSIHENGDGTMGFSFKNVIKEKGKYVLTVSDVELKAASANSVALAATFHNPSYKEYTRALGAYVYVNDVLQEPRAFILDPVIAPHGESRYQFTIENMEKNTEYDIKLFNYIDNETPWWTQVGGPYRIVIDESTKVVDLKKNSGNKEYDIYTMDGRLLQENERMVPGVYIYRSKTGQTQKFVVGNK